MLIERGVYLTTIYGNTPLHLVLLGRKEDVARMLIDGGANIRAVDNYINTPLHLASYWGKLDLSRMLTERGADVKALNYDAKTPLHLVSAPSEWSEIRPQERAELVHMPLEHGAHVHARSRDGSTPFSLASQYGHKEILHVLTRHRARS